MPRHAIGEIGQLLRRPEVAYIQGMIRRPTWLWLLLLSAAVPGCYSAQQLVATRDLGPITAPGQSAPLILRTRTGKGVLLDPNSEISVFMRGVGYTPWVSAARLEVGRQGVRIRRYTLDADDLLVLRVSHLDALSTEALRQVFGPEITIRGDAQGWELRSKDPVQHWRNIHAFILESARRHMPQDYLGNFPRCLFDCPRMPSKDSLALQFAMERRIALGRLSFGIAGTDSTETEWVAQSDALAYVVPPYVPPATPPDPLAEYTLRLPDRFEHRADLPWDQVHHLAIRNISGGMTLAAVAGYTVLSVVLLPLAAAKVDLSGLRHIHRIFEPGDGTDGSLRAQDEPGAPQIRRRELPANAVTAPLFSRHLRRQSSVRFLVTGEADVGYGTSRFLGMQGGGRVGVRIMDIVEIGAGVRYLLAIPWSISQSPEAIHTAVGSFYCGLHLDLDPRRRVAIPLSMDLGAGGPLRFQGRLQLGLRIRAAGPFYVGIYPFSLLLDVPREEEHQAPAASAQLSFRSGIETGVAF